MAGHDLFAIDVTEMVRRLVSHWTVSDLVDKLFSMQKAVLRSPVPSMPVAMYFAFLGGLVRVSTFLCGSI